MSLHAYSTVYYVSNSGNDSNPGTSPEVAWRTLAKVNSFKPSPGDKILFKRGDEWIGTLTIKTTGFPQKPIIYGAYGTGSNPRLIGTEEIKGWTKYSGNIYKAAFTSEPTQLFVNDKRIYPARYPNEGYHLVTKVISKRQLTSSSLLPSINYKGATWLGRTNEWYSPLRNVVLSNSQLLTLNASPSGSLGVNEGFILFNKLEFLDRPDEWFYDESAQTVYLWASNNDTPADDSITGSVYKTGISISNSLYVIIQDFELANFQSSGINISECNHITIENNEIYNCEEYGIQDVSSSDNTQILSNTIEGTNGIGMLVWGEDMIIAGNKIINIGLFQNLGLKGTANPNGGSGMEISGEDNVIQYNQIENTNYNGIFYRHNPIVQYNYIKNSCLVKDDGGGIYTGGEYSGSIVRYNIINSVPGNWTATGYDRPRSFGHGIYIDIPQKNVKVYENTVIDCGSGGIYLHDNANTEVFNNTVFNARYGLIVNKDNGENTIRENLIYILDEDDFEPNQILVSNNSQNTSFESNIYISHYNSANIFKIRSDYYNFNDWKHVTGKDNKSIFKNTSLKEGETEKIFYNASKQTATIELGNAIYNDVLGNAVSGTISIKPFESVILIGKGLENFNQSPVINEQTFNVASPTPANSLIGKITASDADEGQQLYFTIFEGNHNENFTVDSQTGELYVKKSFGAGTNKTFQLSVDVTDDATNPLTANAIITINFNIPEKEINADTEPPVITSFEIPSYSNALTVPIEKLDVSDNESVTGFFFSLYPETPQLTNLNWFSSPLSRFKFSEEGQKTIYVWIRDAAGNISNPAIGTVNIALNGNSIVLSDSVEYITVCDGEEYLAWSESGEYRRTVNITSDTVQEITTYLTVNPVKYETEKISISEGEDYNGWTESGEYERILIASTGCDSVVTTILTQSGISTSSEIFLTDNNLKIYPNPADKYIFVDYEVVPKEETFIQLYNINGQNVLTVQAETEINKIILHPLPSGIYYLKSRNNDWQTIKKMIKK